MNFFLALLLGAASAFAFQPYGVWPLMIVAIAALCELVHRAPTLRRALLIGWGFSVGQFCIGLNWIATAFTYQAAMPAWLGWIAVVLLSFYLAAFMMLAVGLAWKYGRERRLAFVLALAGGWAICEWLRATMFTGFAWNPIGVVLVDTPLMGASGAVGTYGLSALTILIGSAPWLAWRREARPVAAIGAAVLLIWAFPTAPVPETNQLIRPIRIVQPNIGQEDKWREGLAEESFARLESLSSGGIPGPRLLFWPEVAVVEPFQILGPNKRPLPVELPAIPRAAQSVRPGDLLITGAVALIADETGTIKGNTNSVFALDAAGRSLGRYDKAHLVPYGEYLPMRPLLSAIGLSQLAPGQGDTIYGPGPRTIDLGAFGQMGLQVCYEIVFSGEVVDRANRPDFLFNPSNDAWFGRWGPPQHLAMARLRAAEEGLPVIRSTPTGISALIDARGELLASLPWRKAGTIDAILPPPANGLSPFARFGNIIPLALGFVLLLGAIALARRPRYRRT